MVLDSVRLVQSSKRGHEVPTRWFWILHFPSPVRRLDHSQTSGGLGEDCLSA